MILYLSYRLWWNYYEKPQYYFHSQSLRWNITISNCVCKTSKKLKILLQQNFSCSEITLFALNAHKFELGGFQKSKHSIFHLKAKCGHCIKLSFLKALKNKRTPTKKTTTKQTTWQAGITTSWLQSSWNLYLTNKGTWAICKSKFKIPRWEMGWEINLVP